LSSSLFNPPAFGSLNVTPEVCKCKIIYLYENGIIKEWFFVYTDDNKYAEADAMLAVAASATMKCSVSNEKCIGFIMSASPAE
jgi:hypothetical protein